MTRTWHDAGEVSIQRDGIETYIAAAVSPDLRMSLDLQRAEDGQPRRTLDLDDLTAAEARRIAGLLTAAADFMDTQNAAQNQTVLPFIRRAA